MAESSPINDMRTVLQRLAVVWDRSRDEWRDSTARAFEQETIAPLNAESKRTLQAMQALADAMAQARSRVK